MIFWVLLIYFNCYIIIQHKKVQKALGTRLIDILSYFSKGSSFYHDSLSFLILARIPCLLFHFTLHLTLSPIHSQVIEYMPFVDIFSDQKEKARDLALSICVRCLIGSNIQKLFTCVFIKKHLCTHIIKESYKKLLCCTWYWLLPQKRTQKKRKRERCFRCRFLQNKSSFHSIYLSSMSHY